MKPYTITELQLERYLLSELPDEEMKRISALIETDSDLKSRVDAMKTSGMEIMRRYPADLMASRIQDGIEKEKQRLNRGASPQYTSHETAGNSRSIRLNGSFSRNSKRLIYSISAVSAAAAAAFIVILNTPGIMHDIPTVNDNDVVRIKGMEPGIFVHRKAAGGTEELGNLAKAYRGDLIQLGYVSTGEYRYGVILSIDGRGTVTLHYPESEIGKTMLQVNRKVMLQRSYELDDSPGFERFILILSGKPLDAKIILERAKILAQSKEGGLNGNIQADGATSEFSLTLKK